MITVLCDCHRLLLSSRTHVRDPGFFVATPACECIWHTLEQLLTFLISHHMAGSGFAHPRACYSFCYSPKRLTRKRPPITTCPGKSPGQAPASNFAYASAGSASLLTSLNSPSMANCRYQSRKLRQVVKGDLKTLFYFMLAHENVRIILCDCCDPPCLFGK